MALHVERSARIAADEELRQRVLDALARLHFPAIRRLQVEVRQGAVTLHGRLGTFYEKQVSELYIRRVSGVEQIVSRVEVDEKSASQDVPRGKTASRARPAAGRRAGSGADWRTWGLGIGAAALLFVAAVVVVPAYWPDSSRPGVLPLTGTVSFEGQPAVGATVIFHPLNAAAGAPRPTATVGADGGFALGTRQPGDGAPAGEYAVTIEWRKLVADGDEYLPGPNLVPQEYGSAATTPLHSQVVEGANASPVFELVARRTR